MATVSGTFNGATFVPAEIVQVSVQGVPKNASWGFLQFLLNFSGYKHVIYLKGGIQISVWSTKMFLYNINKPRIKHDYMGVSDFKNLKYWTILKYFSAMI